MGILDGHLRKLAEKAALNDSVGSRFVIYHMTKRMTDEILVGPHEVTNDVVLKFITMAISIYISSPKKKYISSDLSLFKRQQATT